MDTDRPKMYLRCDCCGHVVPPTYFVTQLPDGPIRVCGPACGDEVTKTFKIQREKVRWKEVERK